MLELPDFWSSVLSSARDPHAANKESVSSTNVFLAMFVDKEVFELEVFEVKDSDLEVIERI
ncbi:MAG: hypothetical protein IAF58_07685 [Leptolyngbya sp.]|nr:hypothetical protein [Candidatus Melainabacteria bacterium]